jgi:putative spermidine/putrescine transport system ATP-binding protein
VVAGVVLPELVLPDGAEHARLSIRPEDVHLTAPGDGRLTGTVTFLRDLGGTIETYVEVAGTTVVAVSTPRERPAVEAGAVIGVVLPAEHCVVLRR